MLASIALYPDDLLADIFMAATYPLDVVKAARWLQEPQNAALKGDQLFAALQQTSWDPSVKSLAPFPHILRMLDANLGSGTPAANLNPAFPGRWMSPSRLESPLTTPLTQQRQRPAMEGAQPSLDGPRPSRDGIRATFEVRRSSAAGVQPRFGVVQPGLEGVDPDGGAPGGQSPNGAGMDGARPPLDSRWPSPDGIRATFEAGRPSAAGGERRFGAVQPALEGVDPNGSGPVGQSLSRNADTKALIERGLFGRVPSTEPPGELRASRSFAGAGSTPLRSDRNSLLPLVGVGAQPFGARGPSALPPQPFNGWGAQTPLGNIGTVGAKGGG
jgi:hypothetical protein